MTRSIPVLSLLVLLSAVAVGCEDGPSQPYQKLAPGGRDVINTGDPQATYDEGAHKSFVEEQGGTNTQVRCTPSQRRDKLTKAFQDPIVPVTGTKTVDLTVGAKYNPPLTIDDVEKALCPGNGGSFGDQGELLVRYNNSTRRVDQLGFYPGYGGALTVKDKVSGDEYVFSTSASAKKNGTEFADITWADGPARAKWTAEVYNAVISQYSDGLPRETDCAATGKCIINTSFVTSAYLWILPTGTTIWVRNPSESASNKIFYRIEQTLVKISPFSFFPVLLKGDAEGATMQGTLSGKSCKITNGVTWGEFIANCVKVSSDAAVNDLEFNKLMSSLTHDTGRFNFAGVFGTRMYFQNGRLQTDAGKYEVTKDTDVPADTDKGVYMRIDQNTLGNFINDFEGGKTNDPNAQDNHGHGMQQLAFAILSQNELNKSIPAAQRHPIGDPACFGAAPAAGCTGLEGYITAARPESVTSPANNLAKNNARGGKYGGVALAAFGGIFGHGLHPAVHRAVICSNPITLSGCSQNTQWRHPVDVVKARLGKGTFDNVPAEFRDPRGFAKVWFRAMIKYIIAYGKKGGDPTLEEVLAEPLNPNNLFYDSATASGQFDRAEYDIHDYVTNTPSYKGPQNIEVIWDALGGIMNSYQFATAIYRGELALFTSMAETPDQAPGKANNAILTNVFGSTILANNWKAGKNGKTAYDCATALFTDGPGPSGSGIPAGPVYTQVLKDCGSGSMPPMVRDPDDGNRLKTEVLENGEPRLKAYKGAFKGTQTMWNMAKGVGALGTSPITIYERLPLIRSAKVKFPLYDSPYGRTAADTPRGTYDTLMQSRPANETTGFFIALTPMKDKFIKGEELNFDGQTWDGNINLIPKVVAGVEDPSLKLLASVETDEYDGEVFLCKDGADILGVRMFESAPSIVEWINAHPSNSCNLIVQYYPADRSVATISSLTNGVRVTMTVPRGGARIADAELFSTGQ